MKCSKINLFEIITSSGFAFTVGINQICSICTIVLSAYNNSILVVIEVKSGGEEFIVVAWSKDSSGIGFDKIMSTLNDFNKNNNVSPVAF